MLPKPPALENYTEGGYEYVLASVFHVVVFNIGALIMAKPLQDEKPLSVVSVLLSGENNTFFLLCQVWNGHPHYSFPFPQFLALLGHSRVVTTPIISCE